MGTEAHAHRAPLSAYRSPVWKTTAIWSGVALIATLGLGAIEALSGQPSAFTLGGEIPDGLFVPPLVSTALLGAASYVALRAAGTEPVARNRRSLLGVGAVFGFMAVDELLMVHETLERWTGVDWQSLYLPVFGVAGVAWLGVLMMLRRDRLAVGMWVLAAVGWAVAGLLEHLEYDAMDRPVAGAGAMDGAEKALQLTGSWLFLLTMLFVWLGQADRQAAISSSLRRARLTASTSGSASGSPRRTRATSAPPARRSVT